MIRTSTSTGVDGKIMIKNEEFINFILNTYNSLIKTRIYKKGIIYINFENIWHKKECYGVNFNINV